MFNVCYHCGEYHADKVIDPSGPFAICPKCGHKHRFRRLPLFCLTGASGTGKSTIGTVLLQKTDRIVLMESDVLWRKEFDSPQTDWREFRNLWLRVSKNISQSGRPVLLCGCANPGQYESCVEFRYFSDVHYLALVCDGQVLKDRLSARPFWRASGSDENTARHQKWNRWFLETKHSQDVVLLDTTHISIEESSDRVLQWLASKHSNTEP